MPTLQPCPDLLAQNPGGRKGQGQATHRPSGILPSAVHERLQTHRGHRAEALQAECCLVIPQPQGLLHWDGLSSRAPAMHTVPLSRADHGHKRAPAVT